MKYSRREFLVGVSSIPLLGFTPMLREGLYTGEATYTESEGIDFHIALADLDQTQLEIRQVDGLGEPIVWSQPVSVTSNQETWSPGLGAGFDVAVTVPAATLGTGYYEATISEGDLRPENLWNTYTPYQSQNHIVRFTVTPDVPASVSPVLWVEDHLTEACYSGYGEHSIYGPQSGEVRTVGWRRPGVNRQSFRNHKPIGYLRNVVTPLEYTNVARLANTNLADLFPYSLIILCGQLEYVPSAVVALLKDYATAGGHVLIASTEFAVFRTRVDMAKGWVTTFKYDWAASDAHASDPDMAGIGMWSPNPETELCGQSCWLAHATGPVWKDLTLHNSSAAGWIWDGTGLSSGDVLPTVFSNFSQGTLLEISGPEPVATESSAIIWGSRAVSTAKQWWTHDNVSFHESWPNFSSHVTGTLNYLGTGWIIGLPNMHMIKDRLYSVPASQTILQNIVAAATA